MQVGNLFNDTEAAAPFPSRAFKLGCMKTRLTPEGLLTMVRDWSKDKEAARASRASSMLISSFTAIR
jgi:hypothetical protein